jgi:steroid delta-isomerase-like uncharacterized protein
VSAEDNKTLYRRIVEEVWNSGNLAVVDEFIDTNCIFHAFDKDLKGPEQFRQYAEELLTIFPDIHFTIEDLIAERDRVVSHWTATGTQKGEFIEIPATNKNIKFQGATFLHIAGGKVIELWAYWDRLSVMKQLGVAPQPVRER